MYVGRGGEGLDRGGEVTGRTTSWSWDAICAGRRKGNEKASGNVGDASGNVEMEQSAQRKDGCGKEGRWFGTVGVPVPRLLRVGLTSVSTASSVRSQLPLFS